EALAQLEAAGRLSPGDTDSMMEIGKLYRQMGDPSQAAARFERVAAILDRSEVPRGHVELQVLDAWIQQRRAAAFWLAQVYRDLGRDADARAASATASLWGARAHELRALNDRANAATPPDLAARRRLEV